MKSRKSSIQAATCRQRKTLQYLLSWLSIIAMFFGLLAPETSAEEDRVRKLKGKVVDLDGHPVAGAKIIAHNLDTQEEIDGRSNGKGDFEIDHPECSALSFDVYPPAKAELTSAHYSHVSGELSKHIIVQLHKGFKVTGRVLAEGQGIKGLEIKVTGAEQGAHATVHGGGTSHTKGNGEYSFILTPGKKVFQIKNELYSNLAPVYQHEFTITGDTRLPDMNLPLSK